MWRPRPSTFMTASPILLAFAPKCPICFLAYFGIFGVASTTVSQYRAWLPALTALSLALTIGALAFRSRGKYRRAPAVIGVFAAVLIWLGKFVIENQVVILFGLVMLLTAVAWRAFNQRRAASSICLPCEGSRSFN